MLMARSETQVLHALKVATKEISCQQLSTDQTEIEKKCYYIWHFINAKYVKSELCVNPFSAGPGLSNVALT